MPTSEKLSTTPTGVIAKAAMSPPIAALNTAIMTRRRRKLPNGAVIIAWAAKPRRAHAFARQVAPSSLSL